MARAQRNVAARSVFNVGLRANTPASLISSIWRMLSGQRVNVGYPRSRPAFRYCTRNRYHNATGFLFGHWNVSARRAGGEVARGWPHFFSRIVLLRWPQRQTSRCWHRVLFADLFKTSRVRGHRAMPRARRPEPWCPKSRRQCADNFFKGLQGDTNRA